MNWQSLSLELRQFLSEPQTGPAAVAKHIFEVAAAIRRGQFSAATAEVAPPVSDYVFSGLPMTMVTAGPRTGSTRCEGFASGRREYVSAVLDGGARPDLTPGVRWGGCVPHGLTKAILSEVPR